MDDKEPPPGWEIPEMFLQGRYDVGLDNDDRTVFWSMDVNMVRVVEAITELLIMKEKNPSEFQGNIIIRPSADVSRGDYHGRKCEEDSDDGSGRRHGHLQSVGGDRSTNSASGNPSDKIRPFIEDGTFTIDELLGD